MTLSTVPSRRAWLTISQTQGADSSAIRAENTITRRRK